MSEPSASSPRGIDLKDALVLVRTKDTTFVLTSVNGTMRLHPKVVEGDWHHGEIAPGLHVSERDMDQISGYDLELNGDLPGYMFVNHNPIAAKEDD